MISTSPSDRASKVVFIFLDGFGLGAAVPHNPIHAHGVFRGVLADPVVAGVGYFSDTLVVKGIDAGLGVRGIPQSATGQTALFTGINGAELLGYHLPAYPSPELRRRIRRTNLFLEARKLGRSATFANAYRQEYPELVAAGKLQHSVTTVACLAAGVPLRGIAGEEDPQAVCWDITGGHARQHARRPVREISPEEAGARIGGLSRRHDLVVFESFVTDLIGHSRDASQAEAFCGVLKRFLEAVLREADGGATVVLSSDHGNFEDLSTGSHTLNPSLLLARGPAAPAFRDLVSILDVTPAILSLLARG